MSNTLPTTCSSAIAPPRPTGSSVTPAAANNERFCSPISPAAGRSWKPPLMRSMHCIINSKGEVLTGLRGAALNWSQNPLDAVASGHAWLSSTVAAARLHRLRDMLPIATLGLQLIVLRADGQGGWEVVNTHEFSMSSRQEQRSEANA